MFYLGFSSFKYLFAYCYFLYYAIRITYKKTYFYYNLYDFFQLDFIFLYVILCFPCLNITKR